jgi:hypothetical protein
METVQLNVRVPKHIQYQVRMRWFTDGTMPAETVVHALCETYGWSREDIEPIHGQLTVDETQQPGEDGKAGSPPDSAVASTVASRRPRAAEQAERLEAQQSGTENANGDDGAPRTVLADQRDGAVPSSRAPDGVAEEGAAGCPECGADVEQGRCVDCGWINVT